VKDDAISVIAMKQSEW